MFLPKFTLEEEFEQEIKTDGILLAELCKLAGRRDKSYRLNPKNTDLAREPSRDYKL